MEVRTHSVRVVTATGTRTPIAWSQCRGCGERWPIDTPWSEIEQEPCGTREGPS